MIERVAPSRASRMLLAAGALTLLVLFGSCGAGGMAARAGALPAFDWAIQLGQFRVLTIHNGPVIACHPRSFRDSCHQQMIRRDFSISYITPEAGRTLFAFETGDMLP